MIAPTLAEELRFRLAWACFLAGMGAAVAVARAAYWCAERLDGPRGQR